MKCFISFFPSGVFVGAEAWWRAVAGREAAGALPVLGSHQQYRDRLLAPGLFPPAVIRKALVVTTFLLARADTILYECPTEDVTSGLNRFVVLNVRTLRVHKKALIQ